MALEVLKKSTQYHKLEELKIRQSKKAQNEKCGDNTNLFEK